jgi:hypothetical protein
MFLPQCETKAYFHMNDSRCMSRSHVRCCTGVADWTALVVCCANRIVLLLHIVIHVATYKGTLYKKYTYIYFRNWFISVKRTALLWDITRHRVVIVYRRIGTTYRSHLHGSNVRGEKKAGTVM